MTRVDPRTHAFILIAASILTFLAKDIYQLHMMVAASALYLIWNGLFRKTLYLVLAYAAFTVLLPVIPEYSAMLGIIIFTITRMMPMAMIGAALLQVPPGRMMCAFQRAFVPKPFIVMLCILFRFFPLLVLEFKSIRDGIRARGVFPQWHSALLHPGRAYECIFVPLIVRCLKLSSELSASAELRGIECKCIRSSIYPIGIKAADCAAVGLYMLMGGLIYWSRGIVL